jgi:hypothetical protein
LYRPDLVVVQQCRHPLNRAEYLQDWRLILDMDDADFATPAMADALAAVLRRADGAICGSRYVRNWAAGYNPNTTLVWTGGPVSDRDVLPQAQRGPVVTWAQACPLDYPHELAFVERVMLQLLRHRPDVRLRLYGWRWEMDHPSLARMRQAGLPVEVRRFMPYEDFLQSLDDVAVGLCPYVSDGFVLGKSFGKILGYLDSRVPVLCSDAGDHAVFFDADSGMVRPNDPDQWVASLLALLGDAGLRQTMADAAHRRYLRELSLDAAAAKVDGFLRPLLPLRESGARAAPATL